MKKIISKITVRQLMLCFYTICILSFSGILLFGFRSQRGSIMDQNSMGFQRMITQMTQNIESKCERYNNMLTQAAYSQTVQDFLEAGDYSLNDAERVTEYLRNYISVDDTIVDAALFGTNGRQINLSGDIDAIRLIRDEIPKKVPYYYSGMKKINISLGWRTMRECIFLGTQVVSMETYDRGNPIGTLILVLDAEKLLSLTETSDLGTVRQFAFDRNGQVFCVGDLEELRTALEDMQSEISGEKEQIVLDGTAYAIQTGNIPYLESQLVLMISEKDLMRDVNRLSRQQILLFLMALAVELILLTVSINWITRPINGLVDFFRENRENGVTSLKQRVDVEGPKELGILGDNINGMMGEMDSMTHRLVDTAMRLYDAEMEKQQAELEKQQAELEYLYAQINPHFLFNTLESIKGCAIGEDAWKCYKMLDALGKVFRYSTSLEDDVPLREEIRLLKNYLYIQKMRFGEKLDYEFSVPEELLEMRIPKMLLQPIAENAVVHGIEASEAGGTIWIEGEEREEAVFLTVRNSGAPLSAAALDRIRMILERGYTEEDSGQRRRHIGLYNVKNRLLHLYGKESGITVQAEPSGGLCVTVHICRKEGEPDVPDTAGGR